MSRSVLCEPQRRPRRDLGGRSRGILSCHDMSGLGDVLLILSALHMEAGLNKITGTITVLAVFRHMICNSQIKTLKGSFPGSTVCAPLRMPSSSGFSLYSMHRL